MNWHSTWQGQIGILLGVFLLLFGAGFLIFFILKTPSGKALKEGKGVSFSQITDYGDPSLGNQDAPIQVYEFSDFECPYCREASPMMERLVSKFHGLVRFVYKDFPLANIHPHAQRAAEAAQCANEQNRFWEYHDILFKRQEDLSDSKLMVYGKDAGLDMDKFQPCFESRKYKNEVESDFREGLSFGIDSTPTWFVNGHKIVGVLSEAQWGEIFTKILEEKKK
ncbi:MAG: DsbA family protein [Parcubacteria group bacterium]|nr:DsbA family protein [Parcubacteria group bacterium]